MLKKITVGRNGGMSDATLLRNDITFDSLHLNDGNFITFTLMIKENAEHHGGLHLFGKEFGDYPQAIVTTIFD